MSNYKNKYLKYKNKYKNLLQQKIYNQTAGFFDKNYIIVDGTSSAGKTTICKYFSSNGYKCLMGDDYHEKTFKKYDELFKNFANEYTKKNYKRELRDKCNAEIIIDDAVETGKAIIDHINQKYLIEELHKRGLDKQLFVIVVYTNLHNLARNLESRRKEGDPRGIFAFRQFSERYVKVNDIEDINSSESLDIHVIKSNIVDAVNREEFRKILLDNFKYEFENEKELNDFSNKTFEIMEITDDENHKIKLRDELRADYLLDTTNKSKKDIFDELTTVFE